jgi:hypothetical protein
MIKIFMLVILGFQILHSSGQESQIRTSTEEALNLALISERIAKTSPQGLEVIEKVKRMVPEIQKLQSGKTLGEAVEDCINGRGEFVIYPIGWEAVESTTGRWNIFFYFKDEEQKYLKASWGYNQGRNVLIPMESTNATKFWVIGAKKKRP